jgi:hypothetical protein
MIGLIALVAYRNHRKNKKSTQELMASVAELLKALAVDTDTDYTVIAYDEGLLQLIGADAEYQELIDYIEDNY